VMMPPLLTTYKTSLEMSDVGTWSNFVCHATPRRSPAIRNAFVRVSQTRSPPMSGLAFAGPRAPRDRDGRVIVVIGLGELVIPGRLRARTNPRQIRIFGTIPLRRRGPPGFGFQPSGGFDVAFFRQVALALTLELRRPRFASDGSLPRRSD
jgi:hypothetical protein